MRLHARRVGCTVAALTVLILLGHDAEAGASGARLSRDLEARIASGADETSSIIVAGTDEEVRTIVARYGVRLKKKMRGGAVLDVTGGQLAALAADRAVAHLSGDARVQRMMAVTAEATGATQVWSGIAGLRGLTGRGIGVAVIDSGVAQHSALRGHVIAAFDFTGTGGPGLDRFGHGTHVAGIVAGSDKGGYAGIAPGAHIVSLRVLGEDGSGETSDVINAIDFAIDHKARFGLRVINLSLGHPVFESYRDDPLCQAVQRAVDAGLVVVAAAGNFGKTVDGRAVVGGVSSPGNTPAAITVGALNTHGTPQRSDDGMATYSSRGPTAFDGVLKPDVAAPGNKIAGPAAPGSYLALTYPERIVSGHGSKAYIELSGTSMASAVVAGAVALLLEGNPSLTPGDAKLILQITSSSVPGAGLIEAGAGSVNIAAAAAFGAGSRDSLSSTNIAGQQVHPAGIAFGPVSSSDFTSKLEGSILVWGNGLVWGSGLVWGNGLLLHNEIFSDIPVQSDGLVWGNILVWGSQLVTADILVWGNSVQADILVWGNILVWGDSVVNADILVWGNSFPSGV